MNAPTTIEADRDAIKERLATDTPYWAENFAKIIDKHAQLVPLVYKPGQLEFDRRLEAQRAAGRPMRMIVLKARKVGISTATQAKLIQRCTQRANQYAVVIAQDTETGDVLYQIGERIYKNLPADNELKPAVESFRRGRMLHFADDTPWSEGGAFPDSRYKVDTAGNFQSGRGSTPTAIHASEVAFWEQIMVKLTALKNAMPRQPETLFVIESTANGFNAFKDIWDDAEQGRSSYEAFFWPWHKEDEYRRAFLNPREREAFIVGDGANPYAEEEPDLVKEHGLDLEQLNWRRETIADECNGDVRTFHQEYPATPEQAFISTGRKAFDPYRVAQLVRRVEAADPKLRTAETAEPQLGDFRAERTGSTVNRTGGQLALPEVAKWVPREHGSEAVRDAPFKLWLPPGAEPESDYVVVLDPSGGNTETTKDSDYHAIEVIDHKSREQVAEYRSRIEPALLAELVLLVALYFNQAWVGIERTGGWGLPIVRTLRLDYHYPFIYQAKRVGASNEKAEDRLGWDTNMRTKPDLIAGFGELIRIGEDGVKSRVLADEIRTYARTEKGTTEAEPGKYDDCLMAYMIAQQIAAEMPLKGKLSTMASAQRGFTAPVVGGYAGGLR